MIGQFPKTENKQEFNLIDFGFQYENFNIEFINVDETKTLNLAIDLSEFLPLVYLKYDG